MIKKIVCWLLGHKYRIDRVFKPTVRRVKCERCQRLWGMHDEAKCLIPWDGELAECHGLPYPPSLETSC